MALGLFGVFFHVTFWQTEILVPFALMMALSLVVFGSGPRATLLALVLFVAVTPVVERLAAPFASTDWLENGLHVADGTVGWVTLRYLLVDGNYPVISWMAFPLVGMLFWQTTRSRRQTLAWCLGSLGVAVVSFAIAGYASRASVAEQVHRGWTPTTSSFLLTAGSGALFIVSALRWLWGTDALPRVVQPLVLFGRASLTHYVAHIAIAYSVLRLWYPDEDWLPGTGMWAMVAYLAIGIPLTVFWFRHHTHGPIEALLARTSRRPATKDAGESASVEVIRNDGFASLRAMRPFATGEVVFPLTGRHAEQATRFTIQVGANAHFDPNGAVDIRRRVVVARRAIAAGDELRFDYSTTEWELAEPFVCNCGAARCVGVVLGFAHLPLARQQSLLPDVAPHIAVMHATRLRAARRESRTAALGVRGQPAAGSTIGS